MKLSSVHVFDFKSVRDSNKFKVGDITCLVGKNEAGKTAILQALYRLNPIISEDEKFDVTDDYPRSEVEDYRHAVERGQKAHATVIKAEFTLSDDEVSHIEDEYGKGVLQENILSLRKGYENTLFVDIKINEEKVVAKILETAQLPADLMAQLEKAQTATSLSKLIHNMQSEESAKIHIERLQGVYKNFIEEKGLAITIYKKHLSKFLPKLMYFDDYFMLKGIENIDALKKRIDNGHLESSDYPLLGLIELARLNIDEIISHQRTEELLNRLEGAGNHLTKKVLKYWSQNKHLSMKFDVRPAKPGDPDGMKTGTNLLARVNDSKREVSTSLGTRSRGFVWFFSFLSWFNQQQKKNEPLIILLDEPGLFLHGRAQGDLLEYIEKELNKDHQVIYTTHSPFMVDSARFDRVRIVQDKSTDTDDDLPKDQDGTKVIQEVFEATPDSLFPLQGALGYDIYQTLFVGPNCLVVEGVSDFLYLQTISGLLDTLGREGLDKSWTITPVGGSGQVPTFVALLGAQKRLKIATLIDVQVKDRQSIDNLFQKKLLKKQNVLTFADFTETQEADIEDMFDRSFYVRLVSDEYMNELSSQLNLDDLSKKKPRILQQLEEYFAIHPLVQKRVFSHYRPARYFSEKINELQTELSKETLDRFERAFAAINKLL